ncbi:MAG: hypothetical protein QOE35_2308 [Actinomycetota bacterium]
MQPQLPGLERERTWRDRAKAVDPAWWVVALLMVLFFVSYAPNVWRRQEYFGSFGFDMGIFDQAVWLLSRFHSFMTVRGLDFWGHHLSPGMLVFVPFYWMGQGAHLMNMVQIASMALGAVPVFLIARDRVSDRWSAVALSGVYLLHPSLGLMGWELFHPEVMAITPLLFAYWFALRHRWGWYAGCLVYAVMWKEDVALFIIVLGLIVLFRQDRKVGLITVGLGAAWYVITTRIVLPAVTGGVFYEQLYTGIGGSPGNIIRQTIKRPSNITDRLTSGEAQHYLWQMFAPFAMLPLLAPEVLVLGVPMFVANLLSNYIWTRTIAVHYASLPLTALTLATIEAVAQAKRLEVRRVLVGVCVITSVVAANAWGISPIGQKTDSFATFDHVRLETKRQAVAMIPDGDPVSASYTMVAHLSHRYRIYEYPNPFHAANWGIKDDNPDDPAVVRWIVIDTQAVGEQDRQYLQDLVASGEFRVRLDRQGMVVAQRVRAPSRNAEARR